MLDSSDDTPELKEIELFDRWVLLRRSGETPNLDALLAELPNERRSAFRQLLATTGALQVLGHVLKSHVAAALKEDGLEEPVVIEANEKK